jgi:hypothetical protein
LVPGLLLVAWIPLLALIVLFGFVPGLMFDLTDGPVTALANALAEAGK